MRKKFIVSLLTIVMIFSLVGCGKKFQCDICGEEKTGKSYTVEFLGEEITCCKDCHDELQELGNELKKLMK